MKNKAVRLGIFGFIFSLMLVSCQKSDSPEAIGKVFCNCMLQNGTPKPDAYANTYNRCKVLLMKRSRLFKLYKIGESSNNDEKLSQATLDSIGEFVNRFYDYTKEHCCVVATNCSLDTTTKVQFKK